MTGAKPEPEPFTVTETMYAEAQRAAMFNSHAVFYPIQTKTHSWDYELCYDAKEAQQVAKEIGPDAVVLAL